MNKHEEQRESWIKSKRLRSGALLAIPVLSAAIVGCTLELGEDEEFLRTSEQDVDVTKTGSLTRHNVASTSEPTRQADTLTYYQTVKIGNDGTGSSIVSSSGVPTLDKFKTRYGFGGASEQVTYFYNRGDLGIGREMHCVDNIGTNNAEIACYVTNFAAGDDNSEFTFGLSKDIAFTNMDAHKGFATVAMVYRDKAPAANKVYFVVYGADGNTVQAAALDRTGILFATGVNTTSTPGVNFNNHIPSNCTNCHGGSYSEATHSATGSRFLPFDLDQFDYQDVSGKRRADQLTAFKKMNEMAWKVAVRSGSECSPAPCKTGPIAKQLDLWYANTSYQADTKNEVFEGSFTSTVIPTGWNADAGSRAVYTDVIRPMCRNCHITSGISFETEAQLLQLANLDEDTEPLTVGPATDICRYQMPHALQAVREFWFSAAPEALATYFTNEGKTTSAATLRACGPGNVATLDPDKIHATLF